MKEFLRYFVPFIYLLYLGLGIVLRSWLLKKEIGSNPLQFSNKDKNHQWGYFGLVLISCLGAVSVLLNTLSVDFYVYTYPFLFLQNFYLQVLGVFLLVLTVCLCLVAQTQMGLSWGMGLQENRNFKFVNHGLFKYSRNPIYLSVMVMNLGLFFCLPSLVTAIVVLLAPFIFLQIVASEEKHLKLHFEKEYLLYASRVRRWI